MSSPARHFGPRARFTVARAKGKFFVHDQMGQPVSGAYPNAESAKAQLDHLKRAADAKASRQDGPCMCCRTKFPSDGIHNRLCDNCRGHPTTEQMPNSIARSKRRG